MEAQTVLIAAFDPVVGTIIVALVTALGAVAVKWAPKTRPEAAVDQSAARVNDATAWGTLVTNLRDEVTRLGEELVAEREDCALQLAAQRVEIAGLREEVADLRRRIA